MPDDVGESLVRPGERIGRYVVLSEVGRLGTADRFLVRADDGSEHLLGVVGARHPDLVVHLREMRLERVRHRNVVGVVEVVEVGAHPGVVTELVRGPTLLEWQRRQLPAETRLALFRGLVEGVGAAHRAGFVHRDLRPELVVVEGEATARVLDLGVATAIFDLTTGGRSVTTSGVVVGRPHYWAPERARRPSSADARADLFSLGCILYELFAGAGPFAGLNLYDCYHATLEQRFVPLSERCPDAPPAVLGLVPMLLRADPERRPGSCAELLERLDPHTLDDAPSSSSASPPGGVRAPGARRTLPPGGWVVLGAGIGAILATAGWFVFGR